MYVCLQYDAVCSENDVWNLDPSQVPASVSAMLHSICNAIHSLCNAAQSLQCYTASAMLHSLCNAAQSLQC